MEAEWPGVRDAELFTDSHAENLNALADAAEVGDWDTVFHLLDTVPWLNANQWRIGSDSWFAPLHQAAWLGASSEVAAELIRRGAWRSLRNAAGERPIDIALKRNHQHLTDVLAVREPSDAEQRTFAAWNTHLSDLILERTEALKPVKFRPIPTEIIALEPLESLYFGYPGMYGGFSMSSVTDQLLVNSWSRIVGGSGQSHVITESGRVLVEEGFV